MCVVASNFVSLQYIYTYIFICMKISACSILNSKIIIYLLDTQTLINETRIYIYNYFISLIDKMFLIVTTNYITNSECFFRNLSINCVYKILFKLTVLI